MNGVVGYNGGSDPPNVHWAILVKKMLQSLRKELLVEIDLRLVELKNKGKAPALKKKKCKCSFTLTSAHYFSRIAH